MSQGDILHLRHNNLQKWQKWQNKNDKKCHWKNVLYNILDVIWVLLPKKMKNTEASCKIEEITHFLHIWDWYFTSDIIKSIWVETILQKDKLMINNNRRKGEKICMSEQKAAGSSI